MDLTNQLRRSALFNNIDEDTINSFLSHLNPIVNTYEKGEYIAIAGDEQNGWFGVILSGNIEVLIENATGSKTIINILSEGDLLGEVSAFAKKPNWPASAMALQDSTIVFFTANSIIKRCEHPCAFHTELISNALQIISNRAFYLNKKMQYLTAKGIKEKIALYLLEQYNANYRSLSFMLPLSRIQMADFLNVTRPSLSREMAIMKDNGIIDYHRSSVRIKNLKALSKMLE